MKTAHLQEGRIAFQGDIGFRRVAKLPAGAKEQKVNGHIPLVNQRTGHQHTLASQGLKFYESSDPLRAYIVFQGVSEVDVVHGRPHDTHETLRLSVGEGAVLEVIRQREMTPEGWRRVED